MSTDTLDPPTGEITVPEFVPAALPRGRALHLTRLWVVPVLALLMLASLWLRLRTIHLHFWIDEGLSVGIASHPLSHIPSLLRQDGSPPLYYMLLHVWMSAFGRSEADTHALSLLFALLTIPVAYWVGSSIFDRRTGLVGALIATTLPYLTTYGEETRMYALVALLSLIVAASFVHVFVFRRRRYLPLFVLSLTAALYTHNWALFLALMSAVAFLVCVRRTDAPERRALWRDGLIALAGIVILFAPWLPTLLYQARHTGAPWSSAPDLWSLTQGFYSLVSGRGGAIALLLGGGAGLFALMQAGDTSRRVRLTIWSLLTLGFGTVLLAWLYSKTTPAWADRYLAVIVGPLLVLFSVGIARAGRLGLVALVLAVGFWVLDPISTSLNAKSNVASVAAAVRHDLGPQTLVLSTQPEQVPTIAYYMPTVRQFGTPLGRVPDPHVMDWRNALARFEHSSVRGVLTPMIEALPAGARIVLVTPTMPKSTPRWLALIKRDSRVWLHVLKHDPRLVRVADTTRGASWLELLPVRADVFSVR